MKSHDTRGTRTLCIRMLFLPVLHIPVALLFGMAKFPTVPTWSGRARVIAVIVSAYGIVAPFLFYLLLHKSADRLRGRGIDFHAILSLLGICGAAFPLLCGFYLTLLGYKLAYEHVGFVLSIVAMGYWSWRERSFLFRPESQALPIEGGE